MEETSLEAVNFNDEIQGLIAPPPETANSFTALLELPPTQAVELLHSPEAPGKPLRHGPKPYPLTSFSAAAANLTFPSNAALIERAARFSVFAGENSNTNTTSNSNSNSPEVKRELPESDSTPSSTYCRVSDLAAENKNPKSKEREKKVKASSKKRKSVTDESSSDGKKLPYVHVRVRRGQATDSHSLAERARREKINARMKLLQELVPGCNKISGMTLVLDKIINHVQSLQQEVEILSMKLAAVNPVIDFNLDCLLATEGVSPMECNFPPAVAPITWPEIPQNGNRHQYQQPEIPQNGNRPQYQQPEIPQNGNRQQYQQPEIHQNGNRQQYQQPWLFDAFHQPLWGREEDNSNFMTPENSLLSYDSSANSVSLHLSQLKMEL